jgi:2-polyprenyl-6-methoxyphenol hydroxylase-like FAD-dependent oxidoreductase
VTLAAALTEHQIDFELIEQAQIFAPVGAGIALMPPALRIAEQLGIATTLTELSHTIPTMRRLTTTGMVTSDIPYPAVDAGGATCSSAPMASTRSFATRRQRSSGSSWRQLLAHGTAA